MSHASAPGRVVMAIGKVIGAMTEQAKVGSEFPHSAYFAHTVRRAYSIAARRGNAIVGLEHLLYALLDDPDALALMEGCDADIASIRVELGSAIEKATPRRILGKSEEPQASKGLHHVLQISQKGARESNRREVDGAVALAALVGQSDSPVTRLLNRHGLSFGKALGWLDSQNARAAPARSQEARASQQPQPRVPQSRAPGPRPQAPSQRPEPPRQKTPPARQARPSKPEPTLEDMLATIRDVIDDEGEGETPARNGRSAPAPRRSSPEAPSPAMNGGQKPLDEAPSHARPRDRARSKSNGATAPQQRKPTQAAPEADTSEPGQTILGKLVERIPRVMREGERELVEARIGREATDALIAGVEGRHAPQGHGVAVTSAMSLYLRAPDGGFMIEPLAPETQWVFDRPSFLGNEQFGLWQWTVLPLSRGSRRLQLVAAARSVDENGMVGDVALPEQVIEVTVRINWAQTLRKVALWAALAIAGGVLAQLVINFLPGLAG